MDIMAFTHRGPSTAHGSEAGANAHSLKGASACSSWRLKVNLGWRWKAYSKPFPLSLNSRK